MSTHEDVLKELKGIRKKISKLHDLSYELRRLADYLSEIFSNKAISLEIKVDYKELEDVYNRLQKTLEIWQDKSEYLRESFTYWLNDICKHSLKTYLEKRAKDIFDEKISDFIWKILKEVEFDKKLDEISKILDDIIQKARMVQKMEHFFFTTHNINIKDNKIHYEDELLPLALTLIKNHHQFVKLYKVKMHERLKEANLEFDAIALFFTDKGHLRSVAIELKETNFDKLIEQLIKRRPYVHYIYGIFRGNPFYAIRRLMEKEYLKTFEEKGIGLIVVDGYGNPHFIFNSQYNPSGKIEFTKTLEDFFEVEQNESNIH